MNKAPDPNERAGGSSDHQVTSGATREGMTSKSPGNGVSPQDMASAEFLAKEGDGLVDWLTARLSNPAGSVEVRDRASGALAQFLDQRAKLQEIVDQIKSDQKDGESGHDPEKLS